MSTLRVGSTVAQLNSVCSVNPRPRTRTLLSKGSSNEKRSGVYGAETRRADSRAESRELRRAESTGTARKTRPKRCAQASARASPCAVAALFVGVAPPSDTTIYTHTSAASLPATRSTQPWSLWRRQSHATQAVQASTAPFLLPHDHMQHHTLSLGSPPRPYREASAAMAAPRHFASRLARRLIDASIYCTMLTTAK